MIIVRKYPFLHEPDEVTFNHSAGDVMDETIDCMHPEPGTVGSLRQFLKSAKHGGYPLTQSPTDPTLIGYIHTGALLDKIEQELQSNPFIEEKMKVIFGKFLANPPAGALDLSKFVDETFMRCVPETPAVQLQQIFRNLGVKLILVTSCRGALVGMITKKSFISHMEELHNHDHAEKPKGGLSEALLPK
eukprot:gnl/TRDRNA2_/TRDRNA2_161620_c0_seq1.p1 gnl/TRDRNA2_/TRDRNA2_161620_c0~~gnl/TRDRNA2_/TRDRNA2_161620_c0_seq1.p1  ORF type:complete len:189 (-),score=35.07 gnl/TRDRNA2_/TRDRNA2_161620_c0_seq1:40-606(-)